MNNLDSILLQKLVDNELADLEWQLLLEQLREDPELMADVGRALIEKQMLDREIGSLLAGESNEFTNCQSSGRNHEEVRDNRLLNSNDRSAEAVSHKPILRFAQLAASILITLALGFALGQSVGKQAAVAAAENSRIETSNDTGTQVDQQTDGPGEFENGNQFDPDRLAEALSRTALPVPDSFRIELLQRGYVVNEEKRFTQIQMPGGRSLGIPTRMVDIEYLGQATIQ